MQDTQQSTTERTQRTKPPARKSTTRSEGGRPRRASAATARKPGTGKAGPPSQDGEQSAARDARGPVTARRSAEHGAGTSRSTNNGLGRYGEQVAAHAAGRGRAAHPRTELALRRGRAGHRRAGRRDPGSLRGEDPLRAELPTAHRSHRHGEGRPIAATGRTVAGRALARPLRRPGRGRECSRPGPFVHHGCRSVRGRYAPVRRRCFRYGIAGPRGAPGGQRCGGASNRTGQPARRGRPRHRPVAYGSTWWP